MVLAETYVAQRANHKVTSLAGFLNVHNRTFGLLMRFIAILRRIVANYFEEKDDQSTDVIIIQLQFLFLHVLNYTARK